MANIFQNFFKKPETSIIGVDIGGSAIKVVQLRKKKGKAVLETYGELALGPYAGMSVGQVVNLPPEKLAEAVRDVLKEAKITTTSAGVAIPFRSSLVSLIEMPAVDEKQLQEMIPIEARKYIPVPISEVTLDWWIVPKEEGRELDFVENEEDDSSEQHIKKAQQKTDVLVVSIHNEVLSNYNATVQASGLHTSFFEIEMFSATRALLSQETSPVMIFDMGATGTKIYILEKGVVRTSHIINKGSQDITISISKGMGVSIDQAEKIKRGMVTTGTDDAEQQKNIYEIISVPLDYIFSEANTALLNYQRHYNKTISKVILTGGGSALRGFTELAKANFQAEVVIGDPFAKVQAPAFLEDVLKATGLEFSVAVGLALRKLQEFE
ncbi:MAG: type IV pilus assembly protein PilM [Candidatus Pacebacteria bacterium]|nr:type IV pilus assembly protein PilM [Candidatus Paceibacterota bacterium]